VTGLTNGTAYTFTVTATNSAGTGPASAASNTVTPAAPPGAPTSVTATAGNGQATVTWTAPTSNGGSTITGYTVTASPGGMTASVGGSTTSTTVIGLANGTPYTFTVTATNSAGTSAASAPSNSVTPLGPPSAPNNVTATGGNAQATVSWTVPVSNGGTAITGYTVTSSPGNLTASASGSSTSTTVSGLTNGTAYTFTVTATNSAGTSAASAPSNPVTPAAPPGAPTNVSATGGNTQATVTWSAPTSNGGAAIISYTVTSSPGGLSATSTTTSATVTGLTNGTSYTFTVTATNSAGTGPASTASGAVVPAGPPSTPTNVSATPGNAQASVSWTAPASNNGAAITSYTVTSTPGGLTATVNGSTTSATVTGLSNGTSYTFTVTATNSAGTSAASTASASVTPAAPPGAPTAVAATGGMGQATVTWTAPASNGGAAITSYTVTSSPGGLTATTTTTSATVTGLTNGTTYTFAVTATNWAGTGAPSSQSNSVTTGITVRTYYYANGSRIAMAVNGTISYIAEDGLGTATMSLSSTGNVVATQLLAPYGTVRFISGTMPTDYGFTGQHADALSGLDYYGSRYYDPNAGQFTSADTILPGNGYDIWGLSRYAYVQNNPLSRTDPTGHELCKPQDLLSCGDNNPCAKMPLLCAPRTVADQFLNERTDVTVTAVDSALGGATNRLAIAPVTVGWGGLFLVPQVQSQTNVTTDEQSAYANRWSGGVTIPRGGDTPTNNAANGAFFGLLALGLLYVLMSRGGRYYKDIDGRYRKGRVIPGPDWSNFMGQWTPDSGSPGPGPGNIGPALKTIGVIIAVIIGLFGSSDSGPGPATSQPSPQPSPSPPPLCPSGETCLSP